MASLVRSMLIYAVPLMIVALAGVYAERSGIINLALEGIMIFGAFMGVLFVYEIQQWGWFSTAYENFKTTSGPRTARVITYNMNSFWKLQGFCALAMIFSALAGALFSGLLAFASINLKADQTIGGTALNLMAPALALFFIRIITQQGTLNIQNGAGEWFMLKKGMLGYNKDDSIGFFGDAFLDKVYLATYVCILLFIIMSVILYRTRFGLRMRSCGENPQASASLGINVIRMRYSGTLISGALAGLGGFVYVLTTADCSANGEVAGFGFLALAVMIFGNWKPLNICGAALIFGLFKCIAASYSTLDINGDGIYKLKELDINPSIYRMIPYVITLLVLAFTSKSSRAPKAEGIPYDAGKR